MAVFLTFLDFCISMHCNLQMHKKVAFLLTPICKLLFNTAWIHAVVFYDVGLYNILSCKSCEKMGNMRKQ